MSNSYLLFGGCVSRDIFNLPGAGCVKDYYARSSLASLSGKPYHPPVCLKNIESSFQRRMVERDMDKSFFSAVSSGAFDFIVMDVLVDRLNVWTAPDGSSFTISNELLRSGIFEEKIPGKVVESGSQEYLALWKRGWKRLVKILLSSGRLGDLLVNKVYWTSVTSSGEVLFDVKRVAEANAWLDKLYEIMALDIEKNQFLEFNRSLLVADARHRWGVSPFHYDEEYYRSALKEINYRTSREAGVEASVVGFTELLNCSSLKDGVYKICEDGKVLEIKMHGFNSPSESDKEERGSFLCCLGGALADRKKISPPFFSGLGVAKRLSLPGLAISDPTLSLDDDLSLGWYAGNEKFPDVMYWIEKIISKISAIFNLRPIVFGGSGGGFAGIRLSQTLSVRATVLVWNPQTSISECRRPVVEDYLKVAFPSLGDSGSPNGEAGRNYFRRCLDEAGIVHDLSRFEKRDNVDLVYMQNISDWHLDKHAIPFLKDSSAWERSGSSTFKTSNTSLLFLGNWGEGHVPPPKEMIDATLYAVSKNGVDILIKDFDELNSVSIFSELDPELKWKPSVRYGFYDDSLEIQVSPPSSGSEFFYSLYVIRSDGEKKVFWYQVGNVFLLPEGFLDFVKLVVFVKDVSGEKRVATIARPLGLSVPASRATLTGTALPPPPSSYAQTNHGGLMGGRGISFSRGCDILKNNCVTFLSGKQYKFPSYLLDSKLVSSHFAESCGIKVPQIYSAGVSLDSVPWKFPSVVKPVNACSSRGVYICYSEDDILYVNGGGFCSVKDMKAHAYGLIEREEVLKDSWICEELLIYGGKPARDVKFYCFYGNVGLVLETLRTGKRRRCWYSSEMRYVDTGKYSGNLFKGEGVSEEVLNMAKNFSLKIPSPFVRIDFLVGDDGVYFGEVTPYPGGYSKFNDAWDFYLGEMMFEASVRLIGDCAAGKVFEEFMSIERNEKKLLLGV